MYGDKTAEVNPMIANIRRTRSRGVLHFSRTTMTAAAVKPLIAIMAMASMKSRFSNFGKIHSP